MHTEKLVLLTDEEREWFVTLNNHCPATAPRFAERLAEARAERDLEERNKIDIIEQLEIAEQRIAELERREQALLKLGANIDNPAKPSYDPTRIMG